MHKYKYYKIIYKFIVFRIILHCTNFIKMCKETGNSANPQIKLYKFV